MDSTNFSKQALRGKIYHCLSETIPEAGNSNALGAVWSKVARLRGKPLTETQDTEKSSQPERRRPRRHQQLTAMTLRQLHQTQCVKMRGQFVLSPDSKACLMRLNVNILCMTSLTARAFQAIPRRARGKIFLLLPCRPSADTIPARRARERPLCGFRAGAVGFFGEFHRRGRTSTCRLPMRLCSYSFLCWGYQPDLREISAIPHRIARNQDKPLSLCMGANVEVRQRGCLHATTAAVF